MTELASSATALRTHRAGSLDAALVGQSVRLGGWVHRRRDLGGLVFIDLRDRDGLVQLSFDPQDDYTHLQIFTDRSLEEMLVGHGFRVIENKARFLPVNMKTTLRYTPPRLDLLVRAYLHFPFKPRAGQMLVVAVKGGESRT